MDPTLGCTGRLIQPKSYFLAILPLGPTLVQCVPPKKWILSGTCARNCLKFTVAEKQGSAVVIAGKEGSANR
jgi:hypothetical protein